jgi:hypothetical protein
MRRPEDGEGVRILAAVDNLAASHRQDVVQLTWALNDLAGFASPTTWAS